MADHLDSHADGQKDEHVTSVLTAQQERAVVPDYADLDESTLAALGYKQEFKRDFSIWESFGVAFSCLGLLPSVASTISYSLGYAGTGGSVWGWLVAATMIQTTAFSMAELCSSMPTAGGLYYASAALAPEGWGPVASWFVGWSNLFGWITAPCSLNYALASMLVTCGEIAYPSYQPQTWHIYLTFLGLLVSQGLIAMQSTRFIGRVNLVGTVVNIAVVIIFVIWFPLKAKQINPSREVWTSFENGTDWPIGWATIMGFLTTLWTIAGFDTPFHLSEECSNSNIASPRAIIMTIQLGMWMGWAIILVIVYTVQNIGDVVDGNYGQPFGSLCLQVLGRDAGLAMFSLNIFADFFVGQGVTITGTRVAFAYSRDGAVPGSRWWSRVDKRTKTPVLATWGVLAVAAVLGLLMFAGTVAINAVFTIGAIAQYTAFTAPIALKLFFNRGRFRPGPWNLGRWSAAVNVAAVIWWLVIVPALCFPAYSGDNLNAVNMNWTCLIYGAIMLFAMIWYAVDARKWFKGPRVNIEHIGRVEGDSENSLSSRGDQKERKDL